MSRERYVHRAESYQALWNQVDFDTFEIPERMNMGVACVDEQDPTATALVVVAEDRSHTAYTFGEVKEQSNRLANALRSLGVGRGDVVAIVNPASLETAVAFMAIFRMGAIALPMSSLFGPDAIAYRLGDSGATAVITSAANAPKVREAAAGSDVELVVIGAAEHGEISYADALASASPVFTPADTASEDPCLLMYTSGTTGEPKGALHANRVVYGHITAFEVVYDFYPQQGDVIWSPADWAWIAGLMDILVPAWWHGVPVVSDSDTVFNPERALWLIRTHKVTLTLLPPTALRMIRATGLSAEGGSMRVVASGAESVGADLLNWAAEFFGCIINEGFGQTELNVCIGNCASVFPVKPGALGKGLPGTVVAVLNDKGEPVTNEVGEIAINRHHPNTMLEYWRKPEATEDKYLGDWLLTGDLGLMDADGYVWFKSRKDDIINSAGYRIGPGEIENSLGSHEAVAMAAVIGVPDERAGEVPKAFVVLKPGFEPSVELADTLRHYIRTRLAAHEVPRQIEFLDALPKTTTGKIMRRALRTTTA